jgi:hypothetical protein
MADAVDRLIEAAVAVAWSEAGTEAQLLGKADEIFEPWPEMDALCAALDRVRPDWRQRSPRQ